MRDMERLTKAMGRERWWAAVIRPRQVLDERGGRREEGRGGTSVL
jgi:ribosomal protein L16/L10AE